MNGIQSVEHDSVFVGTRFASLIGESFGMRTVVDASGVQSSHAGFDVVFREEIAVVIEEELVVIGIAMEEGDAEGLWIFFERTGKEAADDGTFRDESSVGAGGKMSAVAHDGTDVAEVELPGEEIAFPAHSVDGVEGIEDLGIFALGEDAEFPFRAIERAGGWVGDGDDAGVVEGVMAEESLFGLIEFGLGFDQEKEVFSSVRDDSIGGGAGQDDVVTGLESEGAEVGLDCARSAVNKEEFVVVGVAVIEGHGQAAARNRDADLSVAKDVGGGAFGVGLVRGSEEVEIEEVGTKFALEAGPASGWIGVVDVAGFTEEAFAAMLFFVGAGR